MLHVQGFLLLFSLPVPPLSGFSVVVLTTSTTTVRVFCCCSHHYHYCQNKAFCCCFHCQYHHCQGFLLLFSLPVPPLSGFSVAVLTDSTTTVRVFCCCFHYQYHHCQGFLLLFSLPVPPLSGFSVAILTTSTTTVRVFCCCFHYQYHHCQGFLLLFWLPVPPLSGFYVAILTTSTTIVKVLCCYSHYQYHHCQSFLLLFSLPVPPLSRFSVVLTTGSTTVRVFCCCFHWHCTGSWYCLTAFHFHCSSFNQSSVFVLACCVWTYLGSNCLDERLSFPKKLTDLFCVTHVWPLLLFFPFFSYELFLTFFLLESLTKDLCSVPMLHSWKVPIRKNKLNCLSVLPFSSNLLYLWTYVYIWLEDLCFTLIISVLFDWIISSLVSMLNVIRNARTKHFNAYFWIKFHLISSSEMFILMPVWIYSQMFCLTKWNLLQG